MPATGRRPRRKPSIDWLEEQRASEPQYRVINMNSLGGEFDPVGGINNQGEVTVGSDLGDNGEERLSVRSRENQGPRDPGRGSLPGLLDQ